MIVHLFFLLVLPCLFIGVINRVKSLCAGRQGPPVIQPFFDIGRLFHKGQVISSTTSFIFQIAPSVNLATIVLAGLLIPVGPCPAILGFNGDFILFAYLLALGRFFSLLAAMDTGNSFEGMGASREATFSVWVEPAFFILLGTLAFISDQTSFGGIFVALQHYNPWSNLIITLGLVALFILILVEGCRMPVDDPNTHLELTMIHEVMVLDHSGPDLGLILSASAMKMVVLGLLIADLLIPSGLPGWLTLLATGGALFFIAVVIGLLESSMARLRMVHVPQFILVATSIGLLILSIAIFSQGGPG